MGGVFVKLGTVNNSLCSKILIKICVLFEFSWACCFIQVLGGILHKFKIKYVTKNNNGQCFFVIKPFGLNVQVHSSKCVAV